MSRVRVLTGVLLAATLTAAAAQPPAGAPAKKPGAAKLPAFSAEREAAALVFVRTNHPQLADVLTSLKEMNRGQYEEAIRELFQRSELLTDLAIKDPAIYALSLAEWKAQSRVELLAARLTHAPDEKLEAELRQVLSEQVDLKIKRRQSERERLAAQLRAAETAIARLEENKEKTVENQFRRLTGAQKKLKAETTGAGKK